MALTYTKIAHRIRTDNVTRKLSKPATLVLLWVHLLIGTIPLAHMERSQLMAETKLNGEELDAALAELAAADLVLFDSERAIIYLKHHLRLFALGGCGAAIAANCRKLIEEFDCEAPIVQRAKADIAASFSDKPIRVNITSRGTNRGTRLSTERAEFLGTGADDPGSIDPPSIEPPSKTPGPKTPGASEAEAETEPEAVADGGGAGGAVGVGEERRIRELLDAYDPSNTLGQHGSLAATIAKHRADARADSALEDALGQAVDDWNDRPSPKGPGLYVSIVDSYHRQADIPLAPVEPEPTYAPEPEPPRERIAPAATAALVAKLRASMVRPDFGAARAPIKGGSAINEDNNP